MTDRILLRDLRVLARVGVPEAERATPQPLVLDVDLAVDLAAAGASDDVADTVDYGAVAEAVVAAVAAGPVALLERVGALAAEAALALDDRVGAATVTVTKVRPPIPLDVGTAAVVVTRTR